MTQSMKVIVGVPIVHGQREEFNLITFQYLLSQVNQTIEEDKVQIEYKKYYVSKLKLIRDKI